MTTRPNVVYVVVGHFLPIGGKNLEKYYVKLDDSERRVNQRGKSIFWERTDYTEFKDPETAWRWAKYVWKRTSAAAVTIEELVRE